MTWHGSPGLLARLSRRPNLRHSDLSCGTIRVILPATVSSVRTARLLLNSGSLVTQFLSCSLKCSEYMWPYYYIIKVTRQQGMYNMITFAQELVMKDKLQLWHRWCYLKITASNGSQMYINGNTCLRSREVVCQLDQEKLQQPFAWHALVKQQLLVQLLLS